MSSYGISVDVSNNIMIGAETATNSAIGGDTSPSSSLIGGGATPSSSSTSSAAKPSKNVELLNNSGMGDLSVTKPYKREPLHRFVNVILWLGRRKTIQSANCPQTISFYKQWRDRTEGNWLVQFCLDNVHYNKCMESFGSNLYLCFTIAVFAVPRCLSVNCTRMAKHRFTETMQYDNPGILVSDAKDLSEIPVGSPPTWAPNAGGVCKKSHFSTGREVYSSDILPLNICVHPPQLFASTVVDWHSDMQCHQQCWLVVALFRTLNGSPLRRVLITGIGLSLSLKKPVAQFTKNIRTN